MPNDVITPGTTPVALPPPLTQPELPPHKPSLAERAKGWQAQLEHQVVTEPVKTLAIALAAGFVVGKILHFAFAKAKEHEPARRVKGKRWSPEDDLDV